MCGYVCIQGLFLLTPEMDPSRFYGTSEDINIIPGDASLRTELFTLPSKNAYYHSPVRIELDFSDDDVPFINLQTSFIFKIKGKKSKMGRVIWKKEKIPAYGSNKFEFKGSSELSELIKLLDTPSDVFQFFFAVPGVRCNHLQQI